MHVDHKLFSSQNRVDSRTARQCLYSAGKKALRIKVFCERGDSEHLTQVIDFIGQGSNQLEIDQPMRDIEQDALYVVGDELYVYWSDKNKRYGAKASVISINSSYSPPSYVINLEEPIYYLDERRVATRVPINTDDGVEATLKLSGHEEVLSPDIQDISSSGIRLSLPAVDVVSYGLSPKMTGTLSLRFPEASREEGSQIFIAWLEGVSRQDVTMGCRWEDPSNTFLQQIEQFIQTKERRVEHSSSAT